MPFPETLDAAVAALVGPDPDDPIIRATLDARELPLPGVWIRLRGLGGPKVLATGGVSMSKCLISVYCAVETQDPKRVYAALQALSTAVCAVIPPMTEPRHVQLVLPGGGTPASALTYDHDLRIEE